MSAVAVAPRVLWNASASVPIGFYTVRPVVMPATGELVAVMPDKPLADFLVARGYLGRDVPLLKRVMARHDASNCLARARRAAVELQIAPVPTL